MRSAGRQRRVEGGGDEGLDSRLRGRRCKEGDRQQSGGGEGNGQIAKRLRPAKRRACRRASRAQGMPGDRARSVLSRPEGHREAPRSQGRAEPRPIARPRSKGTRLESSPIERRARTGRPRCGRARRIRPYDAGEQAKWRLTDGRRPASGYPERAERRREQRVGGEVVTAGVPGVVPQREADLRERWLR